MLKCVEQFLCRLETPPLFYTQPHLCHLSRLYVDVLLCLHKQRINHSNTTLVGEGEGGGRWVEGEGGGWRREKE